MIKANELRIGNLILWNPKLSHPSTTLHPTQIEVTSILQDKIGYISAGMEHRAEPFEDDLLQMETSHKPTEELEPIPLTSELLEKYGFEIVSGEVYRKGYFVLEKLQDDNEEVFQLNGYEIRPKITYLHQLQNIYFVLTGEELEAS